MKSNETMKALSMYWVIELYITHNPPILLKFVGTEAEADEARLIAQRKYKVERSEVNPLEVWFELLHKA